MDRLTKPAAAAAAAAIANDPRWTAVLARDATADGRFWYAVRTTGVYCRPSCGARTPRPENVEFHDSTAAAEAAGFRPCRRCTPDRASVTERHAALVAELCRFIETTDAPPTLAALAERAGFAPHHLHRVFKAVTGVTPRAYAAAHRVSRMQRALPASPSVTAAVHAAGYGSSGRFYAEAGDTLGMAPATWRRGGVGERIQVALGTCSLGALLVARTTRGLCAIALGDDPAALARDLRERLPRAEFVAADAAFASQVRDVVAFIDDPHRGLALPLDIRGTAFQHRVWEALRAIPAGETLTYTELARRLGLPTSVRAVARACATNVLAVAIPCHRVVREDGSLAGYRWGLERKRALIGKEGKE